jgi:hypothetical protein
MVVTDSSALLFPVPICTLNTYVPGEIPIGRVTASWVGDCEVTVSGPYDPSRTFAVPGPRFAPSIVSVVALVDVDMMVGGLAFTD